MTLWLVYTLSYYEDEVFVGVYTTENAAKKAAAELGYRYREVVANKTYYC